MTFSKQKVLLILIDDSELWEEERLYEVLVRTLQKLEIAGATVLPGAMGYGSHRRIHRKGLFGVRDEKPIGILATDEEAKIRDALPTLLPMIREGIVMLLDAEVVFTGSSEPIAPAVE
jgi:uncharacterized protein